MHQEINTKIPYPIKLEEEEQLTLVLEMRKDQLELSLALEEWTDAHKISGNVYQLMNKARIKKTEQ